MQGRRDEENQQEAEDDGAEGEQGEEEEGEDDIELPDATVVLPPSMAHDGLGDNEQQPKKKQRKSAASKKSAKAEEDDEVGGAADISDAPDWLLQDPKFKKIVEKCGKVYPCFLAMNAGENFEKRKPLGHQLRGAGS